MWCGQKRNYSWKSDIIGCLCSWEIWISDAKKKIIALLHYLGIYFCEFCKYWIFLDPSSVIVYPFHSLHNELLFSRLYQCGSRYWKMPTQYLVMLSLMLVQVSDKPYATAFGLRKITIDWSIFKISFLLLFK